MRLDAFSDNNEHLHAMHMYAGYHFWGMNLIWWIIWLILIFWIFASPYQIPYTRSSRANALDILQKRFARGEITEEEFKSKRATLGV